MVTRLEANGMEMPPERAVTFASFIKSLMAAATTSGASFTDFPIGCLPYGPSAISPYVSRIAAPRDARSCTIFNDDLPPRELDVGMVTFFFCNSADLVGTFKRFFEITEFKFF